MMRHKSHMIVELIKMDLIQKKMNNDKFLSYFNDNLYLCKMTYKRHTLELLNLIFNYLKQLEKHQMYLPTIIQMNQKYFFLKAPDQMIQLITILASHQPGFYTDFSLSILYFVNLFLKVRFNLIQIFQMEHIDQLLYCFRDRFR